MVKLKIVLLLTASTILISILAVCINRYELIKDNINIEDVVESVSRKESNPISITLSMAGDVTLGNYHGASFYGTFDHEFESQDCDYSYFLENVNEIFEKV